MLSVFCFVCKIVYCSYNFLFSVFLISYFVLMMSCSFTIHCISLLRVLYLCNGSCLCFFIEILHYIFYGHERGFVVELSVCGMGCVGLCFLPSNYSF